MDRRSVLFVSKPIAMPFNDGSRSIVVGLAREYRAVHPMVMTTEGGVSLPGVESVPVYREGGGYAPGLSNNLRAALHLMFRAKADLWHFVFAPNPATSGIGRLLHLLRGRKVVQTIASRPRVFDSGKTVLFGDRVVAQSEDTRRRFVEAWERAGVPPAARLPIEVIPPPLGSVRIPDLEATRKVRRELEVGDDVPLVLYPGDLEVSQGAARMVEATRGVLSGHPSAVVVFAYRDKTPQAREIAERMVSGLPRERVRLVREARDILALVRTSAVLGFPVDDLYGKVDIPIILLEAMELGTPVVVTNEGPLQEIQGVSHVHPNDGEALVRTILDLITNYDHRHSVVELQRQALDASYRAERVARRYEALYQELLS